ncbi:MAG: hypothetical protein ACE5I9_11175, partial [Candidatus Methylomirabilales bacterium]
MRHFMIRGLAMGAAMLLLALASAGDSTADQVISDDLIVEGQACIGEDCQRGERFIGTTLLLKDRAGHNSIRFEDSSFGGAVPETDWRIRAVDPGDLPFAGPNHFFIDDMGSNRATPRSTPFTIKAGAPTRALVIDRTGNLGIGTGFPGAEIHVRDGDAPTLRLEQRGTSDVVRQTWDLTGDEAGFFVTDATQERTPFTVQVGAPNNALVVSGNGNLGIGTAPDPQYGIHLKHPGIAGIFLQYEYLTPDATDGWFVGGSGTRFWVEGSSTPFEIDRRAPDNALKIDAIGALGLGTDDPRDRIHVRAPVPGIRLENAARTWRVVATDARFWVENDTGGSTPLSISRFAPEHSLYVSGDGVGFGTATPTAEIHARSGDTPTLRLEQDDSLPGRGRQTWEIAGNDFHFVVIDVTNGSGPLKIRPGAPTNSLAIQANGDVGIGTASPERTLHVGT